MLSLWLVACGSLSYLVIHSVPIFSTLTSRKSRLLGSYASLPVSRLRDDDVNDGMDIHSFFFSLGLWTCLIWF